MSRNEAGTVQLQQVREAIGFHDRDSIFANHLDESIGARSQGVEITAAQPDGQMRSVNASSARFVASA